MSLQQRLDALKNLKNHLLSDPIELQNAIQQARNENAWFTVASCKLAIKNLSIFLLNTSLLNEWAGKYAIEKIEQQKKIGLVAAGNIPLISMHDILCVLISGHQLILKISEKDKVLVLYILEYLSNLSNEFKNNIIITNRLKGFDAVIATGSDNSSRYFDYYFQNYPHIIRRNRSSLAVINGKETAEELTALGHDIFDYYGLGCRNISHLLVPDAYDFSNMKEAFMQFKDITEHHKYSNNLDYQRTVYLMNNIPYLNIDHINMIENTALFSPLSCLHYHYYSSSSAADAYILEHIDSLQCICGDTQYSNTNIGETQSPGPGDYADNIDTLSFLCNLS